MKKLIYYSRNGSALVTTMIIIILVSAIVGGVLSLISQDYRLSKESAVWSQSIHTAEAGIEYAMQSFQRGLTNLQQWDSWSNTAAHCYQTNITISDPVVGDAIPSFFTVAVDTNTLTIISTGTITTATSPEPLERTIEVVIEPSEWKPFQFSLLGKGQITHIGNASIDSFDSTDPAKSTDGQYDPAKSQDNATLATISTNADIILGTGGGVICGDLLTGPGGTVDIGGAYVVTGTTDDSCEMDIPDVVVPFDISVIDSGITCNPAHPYTITVSGDEDMAIEYITMRGDLIIQGSGRLRIYVDGEISSPAAGTIIIDDDPDGSDLDVEIYANDDIKLYGVVNAPGNCTSFAIYGTPNCTDVDFMANNDFIGTIYAPQAYFELSGTCDFSGAVVADTIKLSGTGDFHYDESLSNMDLPFIWGYNLVSWTEL